MPYPPELIADRKAVLRRGLDVGTMAGLEIGPLAWPIVGKDDGDITYVDHFDTATLRARYRDDPNVPVADIVPVDALWGERTLADCLGQRRVDYVMASHVGEHVPDLITWLAECESVLAPKGELRLALPDRRFSFDVLRQETCLTDILVAYLVRARRPQVREVLDFLLHYAPAMEGGPYYEGRFDPATLRPHWTVDQALSFARRALNDPEHYEDVHCWAFTPRSFARCMRALAENGLTRFRCSAFVDTSYPWFEFYAFLQPTDDPQEAAASWRGMEAEALDPIPGSAIAAAALDPSPGSTRPADTLAERTQELQWARERIAAMEASTSWRVTRVLRALGRLGARARHTAQ